MPTFDRFDICEAYWMLEKDWNISGTLTDRPTCRRRKQSVGVQLHRMQFKMAPGRSEYEELTENGRAIYVAAVRRLRLGATHGQRTEEDRMAMTIKEYDLYCAAVARFFEENGLANLSTVDHDDGPESFFSSESFFTWRWCECCQRHEGGDRYECEGYNPETEGVVGPFDICIDCYYFAEYGRLDDTTMYEMTSGVLA